MRKIIRNYRHIGIKIWIIGEFANSTTPRIFEEIVRVLWNLIFAERESTIRTMEISELSQNLTGSFEKWNSGQESLNQVDALNATIDFAAKNGIELSLVIQKGLLDSKGVTKAINRENAIEHSSGIKEHIVIFDIPSDANMNKIDLSKKLSLNAVEKYRDLGTVLILKHKTKGVIGIFIPGEVFSLGVK